MLTSKLLKQKLHQNVEAQLVGTEEDTLHHQMTDVSYHPKSSVVTALV